MNKILLHIKKWGIVRMRGDDMNYIDHNVEEHDKAKKIAEQVEKARKEERKRELFEELYVMIYAHHHAEEEVVFPAVMNKVKSNEDMDTVREMKEEHSLASYQFSVVEKTGIDNETWDAKFTTLMEVVEHHMNEEEDEFAKIAKKVLSNQELEDLLENFEEAMAKYEKEKKADLK